MRRVRLKALAIPFAFTASISGCSFLLDFGDLQTGSQTSDDDDAGSTGGTNDTDGGLGGNASGSGAGGNAGTDSDAGLAGEGGSGVPGDAGTGDAGVTCPVSTDPDPCLQMVPDGDECVFPGLIPDGQQLNVTPTATSVRGITLVAGNSRFYLTVHGEFDAPFPGEGDARIFGVHPTDPVTAVEGSRLRSAGAAEIQSRVVLVPDDANNSVHAFFAHQGTLGLELAQIDLDEDLEAPSPLSGRGPYAASAAASNIGPAAGLSASGEVFAAWPNPDGVAFYGSTTAPDGDRQLSTDAPRSLAALNGTGSPAVSWTVGAADPRLVRFASVVSTMDTLLEDTSLCPAFNGLDPFSLKSSPSPDGSTWVLTLSASGTSFQSLFLLAACSSDPTGACVPADPDCTMDVLANASDLTLHPANQPGTGRVFSVVATALAGDATALSAVSLLDEAGEGVGPAVGLALGAPRNHEIAVLAPRVAVSWVDTNATGDDVVRLRRFSICYPPEPPMP